MIRVGIVSIDSFNTQPPEGGWKPRALQTRAGIGFNTQPPEGGWDNSYRKFQTEAMFQHTAA